MFSWTNTFQLCNWCLSVISVLICSMLNTFKQYPLKVFKWHFLSCRPGNDLCYVMHTLVVYPLDHDTSNARCLYDRRDILACFKWHWWQISLNHIFTQWHFKQSIAILTFSPPPTCICIKACNTYRIQTSKCAYVGVLKPVFEAFRQDRIWILLSIGIIQKAITQYSLT